MSSAETTRLEYKHFRMDLETHARLARMAKAERRTMAAVIRHALHIYETAATR
jgi:hypothetical protein